MSMIPYEYEHTVIFKNHIPYKTSIKVNIKA